MFVVTTLYNGSPRVQRENHHLIEMRNKNMKRFALALSMFAVLGLTACANGGTWTPMSDGRTAGTGTVEKAAPAKTHKADKTFNKALHK